MKYFPTKIFFTKLVAPTRHPGQSGVCDWSDILIKEDWTLLGPQWTSKIKVENKQDDKETIMLTNFIRTMTRT